ncbi:O-antigen ligase family protein [Immundisolibacter sp.]
MSAASRAAAWRARGPEQLTVPLVFFLAGFFLLPSGKALNNVYYALVLAPAVVLLRAADWRWLAASRLWRLAVVLLSYLALSGLWSREFTIHDWLGEAKALSYLVVYLAVLACVRARRPVAWEWLVKAVVLAAAAATLISAVLLYRTAPWAARLDYYGAVYNANEAATLVGGCLMLVLFQLLPAARGPWRQAGWLGVALILAAGIALTGSRMPQAAVAVCAALGLALSRQWRLLGFAAVALALMIGALLASGYDYQAAVARGDSYRSAIWQNFAARVARSPWLGEGILTDDSTQVASRSVGVPALTMNHPHNVYLATTLYGGLPALAMLVGLVWLALVQGALLARGGEPAWLMMLLVGLLCMLTDGDRLLHAPRGIWFYFWLPVGVLLAREAAARSGHALAAGPVG